MTINVKSCKKINERAQTVNVSVYCIWNARSRFSKTWKSWQTKTPISQSFQIIGPIQGGTIWKSIRRGRGDIHQKSPSPGQSTTTARSNETDNPCLIIVHLELVKFPKQNFQVKQGTCSTKIRGQNEIIPKIPVTRTKVLCTTMVDKAMGQTILIW